MAEAVGSTIRSVSRSWYHHHHHRENYSNNIGQLNFTYINMTSYYSQESQYSSFASPRPSPHRVNVLVAFIFPVMIELIQLMYQANNNKSPFELTL
ncbi:hypothetical protein RDI58_020873 [Solanum bulbocastanum]|uniref:Uncharacterized protein n=1 Tax=Solanum bulbocastanum TaxID=147425 RepID=A0AAN8TD99_SOLBU